MSLPANTPAILLYLGFKEETEYQCVKNPHGVVTINWRGAELATEQEIIDAGNSQAFADWYSENGGDETLTTRRRAAVNIDADAVLSFSQRAELAERNKRDNYLVTRIIELQNAMDAMKASSGAAQNIRDAIPSSWSGTATRDRSNAIASLKDAIDAGDAD